MSENDKYLTVGKLENRLAESMADSRLESSDLLIKNSVGNLSIVRGNKIIGHIALLDGTIELYKDHE